MNSIKNEKSMIDEESDNTEENDIAIWSQFAYDLHFNLLIKYETLSKEKGKKNNAPLELYQKYLSLVN
jgi:hypothetical protein